jgi:hypothetical protein
VVAVLHESGEAFVAIALKVVGRGVVGDAENARDLGVGDAEAVPSDGHQAPPQTLLELRVVTRLCDLREFGFGKQAFDHAA